MRFLHHMRQQGGRLIVVGRVALEQLARRHHHLIRRFAPTTAPAHAIGQHAEHAAIEALVRYQRYLILLILTVSFVDTS